MAKPNRKAVLAGAILALGLEGCRPKEPGDGIPSPGRPSAASHGESAVRVQEKPKPPPTEVTPGTDVTGRPGDASGGATAADASSDKESAGETISGGASASGKEPLPAPKGG